MQSDKKYRNGLLLAGIWTAFAFFMLVQGYLYRTRIGQEFDFGLMAVRELIYAYGWAALTPLVLFLADRFRVGSRPIPNGFIHLLAGLGIAAFHKFSTGILGAIITSPDTFSLETEFGLVIAFLDYGLLVYSVILLVKYSYDYFRRYHETEVKRSQLEARLAKANLDALKMQIRPHFLFNTLNAISVLIGRDPEAARKTLGRLSDLLRLTLENGGDQKVRFRTEIEFLERYLQIEQTRFGERLRIVLRIDPSALDASVPNMILQPIVENAIKHGINEIRGPGRLEITAVRSNGMLSIRISDNGRGLSDSGTGRNGVGLKNTRERLRMMYGEEFRLDLANRKEGGAEAVIEIPFRTAGASVR